MSAGTELKNMQPGIPQLLPDLTTLSLIGHRSQVNLSHHATMQQQQQQPNGDYYNYSCRR
jgi:hypothetical protein